MASNVESDKARKEKLRRCRKYNIFQRERKNSKAILTELEGSINICFLVSDSATNYQQSINGAYSSKHARLREIF